MKKSRNANRQRGKQVPREVPPPAPGGSDSAAAQLQAYLKTVPNLQPAAPRRWYWSTYLHSR